LAASSDGRTIHIDHALIRLLKRVGDIWIASSIASVVESVSATRILPAPRCRVATSSRLVMQPIRDRASCKRSITMGASASPAIKLQVSLARTKATLASKRPMAIDAKPSAQAT
jgi:hypothetical protein